MQNLSCENEFYLHDYKKSFLQERFSTWPCFKTRACGISEMAYSAMTILVHVQRNSFYLNFILDTLDMCVAACIYNIKDATTGQQHYFVMEVPTKVLYVNNLRLTV